MPVAVITPPGQFVSLADAKAHLRVVDPRDDALITAYVAAAAGSLDGPAGYLGRALAPQTLELRQDGFTPSAGDWTQYDQWQLWERSQYWPHQFGQIRLPCQPIIDIVSVKYDDNAGVEQTLSSASYSLKTDILALDADATWPIYRAGPESVRIRYRAGYTADPAANPLAPAVPAPIYAAVLLMVGDLYENREASVMDARAVATANPTVERLLSPFRVWS